MSGYRGNARLYKTFSIERKTSERVGGGTRETWTSAGVLEGVLAASNASRMGQGGGESNEATHDVVCRGRPTATVGMRLVYEGRYFHIRSIEVPGPSGGRFFYEVVERVG